MPDAPRQETGLTLADGDVIIIRIGGSFTTNELRQVGRAVDRVFGDPARIDYLVSERSGDGIVIRRKP